MTDIFVSARSLAEYRDMFLLTDGDLSTSILDCAAGGSSFTAELTALGGSAVAVDPAYGQSFRTLSAVVAAGVRQALENIADDPAAYEWGNFFASPAEHGETRSAAARRFLDDFAISGNDRYVPCKIDDLLFPNDSFDLVLCSHLLFTYASVISLDSHLRICAQMLRVARAEVRIFPLLGFGCDATSAVNAVQAMASVSGHTSSVVPVPYRFWKGTGEMLVLKKRDPV